MSAVDRTTGEIVGACSAGEARDLTERIKQHAETLWALLLEAHDRQAWKALGYSRWEDYVRTEFDMARSYSYQVLDQGRVIRELRAVSANADITVTEKEARDIKPHLEAVTDDIRQRVDTEPHQPTDARTTQIVRETVERYRDIGDREAKAREVMREVRDVPQQDPERVHRERKAIGAINTLADLDDPDDLAAEWSPHARYHLDRIEEAQWALDRLRAARKDVA